MIEMECFPVSPAIVQGLYRLACTPFVQEEFEAVWRASGWIVEPDRSDIEVVAYRVSISPELLLEVFPKGPTIYAALVSFCFYGNDTPQQEYDAAYLRILRMTEEQLGPAYRYGQDGCSVTRRTFHYSIWRGTRGLLILQQSDFDVLRGDDINFWLQPWTEGQDLPVSGIGLWLERKCCERFAPDPA